MHFFLLRGTQKEIEESIFSLVASYGIITSTNLELEVDL